MATICNWSLFQRRVFVQVAEEEENSEGKMLVFSCSVKRTILQECAFLDYLKVIWFGEAALNCSCFCPDSD